MKPLHVLGLCGSLRKASTNMGLLRYLDSLSGDDFAFHVADLTEIPFYNPDTKLKTPAVEALMGLADQADAFVFACPEYNYSVAPVLKNAIDWLSREPKNYLLAGKTAAIVGAGGGMGTARAQYHLRQTCVYLDLHMLNKPEVFCHAFNGSFDEQGTLQDAKVQELLAQQLKALLDLTCNIRQ